MEHGQLDRQRLAWRAVATPPQQIAALAGTPSADLAITPTLTATNQGPAAATGLTVSAGLPAGLTYLSDTCSSAYNSGTSTWAVPAIAVTSTKSITFVATLTGNGPIQMLSQISSGPVNTVPGNDPTINTINVPAVTGGTGHCGA